jgi:hypothetical protein
VNEQKAGPADASAQRLTTQFKGLLLAVLLLAATLAVGYVSGIFAAGHGQSFNWETGALASTAFATAALAAFTGLLAYTTRIDVSATWELARQGEIEQKRRDRPAVVVTSFDFASSTAGIPACVVGVRNAGVGPAVYITVKAAGFDGTGTPVLVGSSTAAHFLGPGEEEKITVAFAVRGDFSKLDFSKLAKIEVNGDCLNRVQDPYHFMWRRDEESGETFFKL